MGPAQMFDCKKCQQKALERRELMKKFGFRNAGEYLEWQRTHEEIKKQVPMEFYERETD
jgi:hypothetical protein